jgi:hypothetical protein
LKLSLKRSPAPSPTDAEPKARKARSRAAPPPPSRGGYQTRTYSLWLRLLLIAGVVAVALFYGFRFATLGTPSLMTLIPPIALVAIFLIWALPPGEYAPTSALIPLYFAFVAAQSLWPNYLAVVLPGLPWLTVTRTLGTILVLLLLICISVSKTFRQRIASALNADKFIWRCLVGFTLLQAASILWSPSGTDSLNDFISGQIISGASFFASVYLFRRAGFAEFWAKTFLVVCAGTCFLGLWENRLGIVPWAGHIPSFLRIDDPLVIKIIQGGGRAATGLHRIQATATTPLSLAELIGLSIPFGIHFVTWRYPLYLRLLAAAYIFMGLDVIMLTDSRLGFVAALVSAIFYLLMWAMVRWREHKGSIFAPAIVFSYPAILILAFFATFAVGRLRARVWGSGAQQASTDARKLQWEMAIPKIAENPFGYGIGTAGKVLGFKNQAGVGSIDSFYLSVLLDFGILGFVLYFGMLLRAIFIGGKLVYDHPSHPESRMVIPFVVSLIAYIVVKGVLSQESNNPYIHMMLAGCLAMVATVRTDARAKLAQAHPA